MYKMMQDEEIQRILESENIQMLDAEAKVRHYFSLLVATY